MRRFTPSFLSQSILAAALLMSLPLCKPHAATQPVPSADGVTTWTFFFYDNADFQYAGDPLPTFAGDAHSGPNLDVIVLRDREHDPADLWHVGENHELTHLANWGEVNMGDPETLTAFLEYGKTNYPADRYLLAMYGHGGGWTGACRDHTDGDDKLSMNDFQLALTDAGPVDLICFTAPCNMGAIESAYELRDCVDVYVGSEEVSGYVFWWGIMGDICDRLISFPDDPSETIGAAIVQLVDENDFWEDRTILTMSAVSSATVAAAMTSVDRLAQDLIPRLGTVGNDIRLARNRSHDLGKEYADRYGLVDLHDFTSQLTMHLDDPVILQDLEEVRLAIDHAVVAECHGPTQERSHGLSIYFHRGGPLYDPTYESVQLDFADHTAWDEFLNAYHDTLGLPASVIVTGPGAAEANPPLVRTFDPVEYGALRDQWSAYGVQAWGVNTACGDLDGNGIDEVITGPGPGAVFGPHVRGFSPDGLPIPGVSYLAYGTNRYGVNVACGDLDGDGRDEILTGPGPSNRFGAHVRGWRYDGVSVSLIPQVDFFAYYLSASQYGVRLAAADIHGDGIEEILTLPGPDPSEPAAVRVWRVTGNTPALVNRIEIDAYNDLGLTHGGTIAGGIFDSP